jgi:hypothetical protein
VTTVGLAWTGPDPLIDSIHSGLAAAASEIGIETRRVAHPTDDAGLDVLLIVGYPASYRAFLEHPPRARRIAWFGEPLPRLTTATVSPPSRVLRAARRLAGPITRRQLAGPLGRWREEAAIAHERADNLAQAVWCSQRVDRVVVTSRDRYAVLRLSGIESTVVPFGYHAASVGALAAPDASGRDIAVIVIGSGVTTARLRRGRILAALLPRMQRLGPVVMLDGRWGTERESLLRRSRVVLDIQRVAGNFTGLRHVLALAAGAPIVSEPIDDPYPFVEGIDHLEAPANELDVAVQSLIDDEPRRRRLVAAGQALLSGDLAARRSLERVLAA